MSNHQDVKQYEAFWVRGVGWTLCAADPDIEGVEIDIDLISVTDHDQDIKALKDRVAELEAELKPYRVALDPGSVQMGEYASQLNDIVFTFEKRIAEQAATIKRLRDELNRVAPFLALYGVDGYTMSLVEDWDHPIGVTFNDAALTEEGK